jgi:PST family polysaccharide transporter
LSSLLLSAQPEQETRPDKRLRRVTLVWGLLFLNVIGYPGPSPILPIPHKIGQLVTQGALPAALILALTVNRKIFIRPNWFLGLFSLLAVTSLMMSMRLVSLGMTYRGIRLITFVVVLWLLTPWWRDRGLVLLRSQLFVLSLILASLVIGIVVAPGQAFAKNYGSARLAGVIWPMAATAAGHYMAELTGLAIILWMCKLISRKVGLLLIGFGLMGLLATHTRTALAGLIAGLLVATLSLFLSARRARRAFAISLVVIVTVMLPLSPLITSWVTRGQSSQDLHELSGRAKVWPLVLSAPRPETNKIFGSGMTNDSVIGQDPGVNGLPIDSGWVATYQNQGIVGWIIEGLIFLVLILTALLRPRGPTRAIALFLIVYCLFDSYTETGLGEASPYLLDLTLAASLLVPRLAKHHSWAPVRRPVAPLRRLLRPPEPSLTPAALTVNPHSLLSSGWLNAAAVPFNEVPGFRQQGLVDPQPLSASVRQGAFWSFLTTGLLRFSNLLITAVVAHILAPRSFGIFAIAVTVYAVVVNIGELGVGSCLIRADLDIDALAPTMVTVATISTAVCALAMTAFAKPIATALGSAGATGPIRAMALTVFLIGIFAVPTAQLTRDFKQNKLFFANLAGFIPATAALLLLAKVGDGAMAFAWSRVLTQLGIGCVVVAAVSKIYRPGLARSALSILVRFGLPLAAANFVNYVLLNVDYAFVGHFIGATALGAYMLAFTLASAPAGMLGFVINSVAVPAFSRVKDDPERLKDSMANSLRVVALIVLPVCALMMVLARPLVLTVYGSKWSAAAQVLSILSLYGAIFIICVLFANMLVSLGKAKFILIVQLIWLAALVPAMAVGVHRDGIVGVAIAHIVIIGPLVLPCYLVALKKTTGVQITALARAIVPPLLAASFAALAAWGVASQFADPLLQLLMGAAVGALIYVLAAAPQGLALLGSERAARLRTQPIFRLYDSAARLVRLPLSNGS